MSMRKIQFKSSGRRIQIFVDKNAFETLVPLPKDTDVFLNELCRSMTDEIAVPGWDYYYIGRIKKNTKDTSHNIYTLLWVDPSETSIRNNANVDLGKKVRPETLVDFKIEIVTNENDIPRCLTPLIKKAEGEYFSSFRKKSENDYMSGKVASTYTAEPPTLEVYEYNEQKAASVFSELHFHYKVQNALHAQKRIVEAQKRAIEEGEAAIDKLLTTAHAETEAYSADKLYQFALEKTKDVRECYRQATTLIANEEKELNAIQIDENSPAMAGFKEHFRDYERHAIKMRFFKKKLAFALYEGARLYYEEFKLEKSPDRVEDKENFFLEKKKKFNEKFSNIGITINELGQISAIESAYSYFIDKTLDQLQEVVKNLLKHCDNNVLLSSSALKNIEKLLNEFDTSVRITLQSDFGPPMNSKLFEWGGVSLLRPSTLLRSENIFDPTGKTLFQWTESAKHFESDINFHCQKIQECVNGVNVEPSHDPDKTITNGTRGLFTRHLGTLELGKKNLSQVEQLLEKARDAFNGSPVRAPVTSVKTERKPSDSPGNESYETSFRSETLPETSPTPAALKKSETGGALEVLKVIRKPIKVKRSVPIIAPLTKEKIIDSLPVQIERHKALLTFQRLGQEIQAKGTSVLITINSHCHHLTPDYNTDIMGDVATHSDKSVIEKNLRDLKSLADSIYARAIIASDAITEKNKKIQGITEIIRDDVNDPDKQIEGIRAELRAMSDVEIKLNEYKHVLASLEKISLATRTIVDTSRKIYLAIQITPVASAEFHAKVIKQDEVLHALLKLAEQKIKDAKNGVTELQASIIIAQKELAALLTSNLVEKEPLDALTERLTYYFRKMQILERMAEYNTTAIHAIKDASSTLTVVGKLVAEVKDVKREHLDGIPEGYGKEVNQTFAQTEAFVKAAVLCKDRALEQAATTVRIATAESNYDDQTTTLLSQALANTKKEKEEASENHVNADLVLKACLRDALAAQRRALSDQRWEEDVSPKAKRPASPHPLSSPYESNSTLAREERTKLLPTSPDAEDPKVLLCKAIADIVRDYDYWSQKVHYKGGEKITRKGYDLKLPKGIKAMVDDLNNEVFAGFEMNADVAQRLLERFTLSTESRIRSGMKRFLFFTVRDEVTDNFYQAVLDAITNTNSHYIDSWARISLYSPQPNLSQMQVYK